MTSMDQFKATYFEECGELLESLATELGNIAAGASDDETLNAVFRAVHSIKGGAGAFQFHRLVEFAHIFENLLDQLRDGRIVATEPLTTLLLQASDMLADIVEAARGGTPLPTGQEHELAQALEHACAGNDAPTPVAAKPAVVAETPAVTSPKRYKIVFLPRAELLRRANEPLLILRELKRLGNLEVETATDKLPHLADLVPDEAYFSWTLHLETSAKKSAIEDAFEFALDDCELTIEEVVAEAAALDFEIFEDVVEASAPTNVVSIAPVHQAPAIEKPAATHAEAAAAPRSIRVDLEKVDRVVNLVGELVISQAMLMELSAHLAADAPDLGDVVASLSRNLRELQESVMAMRAQPVKSVFMRMPRLVRETAGQLGKDVQLVIIGEDTEIDKTVIEQLSDPLTHVLRNAMDHGIESPEDRIAKGKPARGTIQLSAEHRHGRVVIEISDDGRGIDRQRVLDKAQSRGLVPADAKLTDQEIDELIFLPGFSTAEQVSAISGRGVGMDVVKRNIQGLGGRISITSEAGKGSRISFSLPLTLAVIEGMLVSVGGQTFVVPLTHIIESLRPQARDVHRIAARADVLHVRGQYIPLVYLHHVFDIDNAQADPSRGIVVIVEGEGGGSFGLVVDELLGQQQVVMKSVEENYRAVDGIGGATILGNGRIALILDIGRLHQSRKAGIPGLAPESFARSA